MVDPLVVSGRWTFSEALAEDSNSSATKRSGWSNRTPGSHTRQTAQPPAMTAPT